MEAKALADSLVEAGIAFKQEFTQGPRYTLHLNRDHLDAESFITKWDVAGKCLESILGDGLHIDSHITDIGEHEFCITTNFDQTVEITYNESLPRAIVEAFCEARQ